MGKIFCWSCGKEFEEKAKRCPECEGEIIARKDPRVVLPRCGNRPILGQAGDDFCERAVYQRGLEVLNEKL